MRFKNKTYMMLISVLLCIFLLLIADYIPLITRLHWKIFGALLKIEHNIRPLPSALKDILLVTIDNETINNLHGHWPYPRSEFAKVIEQLKRAEARLIAFDFIFPGKSLDQDDILLKTAFEHGGKTILAAAIDKSGLLDLYTHPNLSNNVTSGIITKLQGPDGVTRRNLTYLVNEKNPNKGFLSWEMQIIKVAKGVNLATLTAKGNLVSFQNDSGERWLVPIDPLTKSFLIHFRANTVDFPRLSFFRVLNGEFDPTHVKNRIVLIGVLSSVLGDLHHTSIGWLPGITLNANAFLTLYTHDFLKNTPKYIEKLIVIMGVILSAFFLSTLKTSMAFILAALEIFLFFALSYSLLAHGYIWNYFLLPLAVVICPVLSKKICTKAKLLTIKNTAVK
jgi:CHASE2 domain-containing sensor protein